MARAKAKGAQVTKLVPLATRQNEYVLSQIRKAYQDAKRQGVVTAHIVLELQGGRYRVYGAKYNDLAHSLGVLEMAKDALLRGSD